MLFRAMTILTFFTIQLSVSAQNVSIPLEVKKALKTNSENLNPITVSYTWQRQPVNRSPEATLKLLKNPMRPEDYFFTHNCEFSWQNGKFYSHFSSTTRNDDGTLVIEFAERTFDGKIWYAGNRYESDFAAALKKQIVSREAGKSGSESIRGHSRGYFGVVGFQMPVSWQDWQSPRVVSKTLSSKGNSVIAEIKEVVLNDQQLLRIKILRDNPLKKRLEEEESKDPNPEDNSETYALAHKLPKKRMFIYFLDPERNYALAREEEWYGDDTILFRRECKQFEKIKARKLWLPRQIETTYYENWLTVSSDPFFRVVVKVSDFILSEQPDNHFVLDSNYQKSGTFISDGTTPESLAEPNGLVQYVVPASAAELDKAAIQNQSKTRLFFIIVNVVLFISIIVWLCYRFLLSHRK